MKSFNLKVFAICLVPLVILAFALHASVLNSTNSTLTDINYANSGELLSKGDLVVAFIAIIGISIFLRIKK